jgi:hypothetical protein
MSKLGGGIGSTNSPEGTTKSAIMSIEKMDATKVAAYFTPVPGALESQRLKSMFASWDTIDIQNLKCMLVLKEGASARVQAVYDMILSQGGYINTEHCSKTLKLVQIDKKWYINEVF